MCGDDPVWAWERSWPLPISRNIKKSIGIMGKVAEGDLTVWADDKMLKRKDRIGDSSRVTVKLKDNLKGIS